MDDIDNLKKGDAVLEAQEITLREQRNQLRDAEVEALTQARAAAKQLREVRSARAEIQRRIRELENPAPEVSPEVETLIQSVTATANTAANAPPEA